MNKLTIVIPAFNEQEVLKTTLVTLLQIEDDLISESKIAEDSNILVVDDGSKDNTWEILRELNSENYRFTGIKFSRNFGHQDALVAGMSEAIETSDMIVTIDADLQDNPNVIKIMVDRFNEGNEVVYGVRNNREQDTWFKRTTAQGYYRILNILGVKVVPNHADFRLMSKRAVETLLEYKERNLFLRGIIPMLGYKSVKVYYKRTPRLAGESKYPLKKMLAFAWDGITSLTIAPVRAILILGILFSLFGMIAFVYSVIVKLIGKANEGWSSLMISIWIIGGFQMISLGVIGEYIGKVTTEVKHRPRYTIEERIGK
ncbi:MULTISPECIES: glycosyltransferase family 2 protein [Amylolactobacillus]|nr:MULTISPECIES: glycosyltransferase family 2 protein [Amylolactobacillus]APT18291.1 glycosyltransferase [Amylolactobacillus amylophilus DSM 20533 = JCM 1125]GED80112.1 glycosyl transferase [Amylolactobacillus amylophilus]